MIAIVIVILILLVYSLWRQTTYLSGYWTASDSFLANSDVKSMMLVIGEPIMLTHRCCLTIDKENIFTFDLTNTFALPTGTIYARVTGSDVWPSAVWLSVDVYSGSLTVSADGIVYAKLHKDHGTTELINIYAKTELDESQSN